MTPAPLEEMLAAIAARESVLATGTLKGFPLIVIPMLPDIPRPAVLEDSGLLNVVCPCARAVTCTV